MKKELSIQINDKQHPVQHILSVCVVYQNEYCNWLSAHNLAAGFNISMATVVIIMDIW